MLHLAAATRACVKPEMRASGAHTLRGFVVNLGHRALLPIVLFPVHLHRNQLKGQSPLDKNHLAIGTARDALGIHIKGPHTQPALGQVGTGVAVFVGVGLGKGNIGIAHDLIVSGCGGTTGQGVNTRRVCVQFQACRYSCQWVSCADKAARLSLTKLISVAYSTSVNPPRIFWKRQYRR